MDDVRLGALVRLARLRLGWRQADVAARAGVSRSTVLRVEHGQLDRMPIGLVRAVLRAQEMDLALVPRWRGGDLDRLADEGHAVLAGLVAVLLDQLGWIVHAEVSFSVFGERGSSDLLAWHPASRALLVIEVKAALNSVEETLRRLDVKVRLAAQIARERFGWDAAVTAFGLVLPDDATSRRRVHRHGRVLDRAFPLRGRAVRAWLRDPTRGAGFLLFLPDVPPESRRRRLAPRRRVRLANLQPSRLNGVPGRASGGNEVAHRA
jgi:hypothetical protein